MGAKRLLGEVAVITGGSRGLGLALAREFGAAGARLVLCARGAGELEEAKATLVREGCARSEDVFVVEADLAKREDCERVIAAATERFGAVDVLVNNAGIIQVGPVEDQRVESFEDAMRVNYFAMVYATKAVMPQMLARGRGRIVNIASVGGKVAVPHMLPYTASKFAVVGFSQGLNAELRGKGVRVTTVCPGLMRTGSAPQALVVGDRTAEYEWFSLGAMLPVVSVGAARAARRILNATVAGRAEIMITPQAWLGARVMGLMPSVGLFVLGVVSTHLLPKPTGETEPKKAGDVPEPTSKLWHWVKRWSSADGE